MQTLKEVSVIFKISGILCVLTRNLKVISVFHPLINSQLFNNHMEREMELRIEIVVFYITLTIIFLILKLSLTRNSV